MKKLILLGSFFIAFIFLGECKKESDKTKDYRYSFVGNYKVKAQISCYGPCWNCYSLRDTTIRVEYGPTDSTIMLLGSTFKILPSGSYYGYHVSLQFWTDSIAYYYMNGGLGCGTYEYYSGHRISH